MTSEATQATPMSRAELEAKIVARAWEDEEFKEKFLADPKAMFEQHLGTELPKTLVMTAHQEDADHLHFVIPAKPTVDLGQLSDEDLEKVAGGVGPVTSLIMTIFNITHTVGDPLKKTWAGQEGHPESMWK